MAVTTPRRMTEATGRGRMSAAWGGVVERHVALLTLLVVMVTAALALGLPRLQFTSSQDTMIARNSTVARDNVRYQRSFGGEVMIVLFDGDVRKLFSPANRAELARFEEDLARTGWFHAVVGPDTVLGFAGDQAEVAGPLTIAALQRDPTIAPAVAARAASDGPRLAAAGPHTLDNPRFVDFLLFDETGAIRQAQRGAFPDGQHALLVARLTGNLSLDDQGRAVDALDRALQARRFAGVAATATGSAALVKEVNDRMRADMARTGVLAVVAMIVVLLLLLRARWRLLTLPVVALAIVWAFGAFGLLGIDLTLVTISGLPILFGLGVDFAVQVHARYEEEAAVDPQAPLPRALAGIGPALLVALVAAAVGFIALRISPVPMVRDFGVMLAVGTAVLLVAVLVFVPVALVWRDHRRSPKPLPAIRRFGVERLVRGLAGAASARPRLVAACALLIAIGGFAVHARVPVESDPEKFAAAGSPVLHDLRQLREVTGTSADIGLMVEAGDVMRADVLRWMAAYEARQLATHRDRLSSSSSIASIAAQVTGATPTPADVRAVMAVAPPGIERTFLDAKAHRALMLFTAGHLTLKEQERLVDAMQRDVDAPPGVRVVASGLSVVGIEAVKTLSGGQLRMTGAALAAVFAWLAIAMRSLRKSVYAVVPVVTAVGASWLALAALGVTVSVLGALSNPLVIAVCTEFSVLIVERYDEEVRRGLPPEAAVDTAVVSIGRAFVASGLTIAAGFAVLTLSGFPLLSSFGAIVSVNVLVSMVCALVLVPPLLGRLAPSPAASPSTEPVGALVS